MKQRLPLAVAAASLPLLLLGAGCGTLGADVPSEPGPSRATAPDPVTELVVVVSAGPGEGEDRYSLTCDPVGGDHPDPETACRLLDELTDPFAPVPPDTMCTEQYGGPQTATVTGTFRGDPVNARFDRVDGCQIARWDRHAALLVEAGGVGGG